MSVLETITKIECDRCQKVITLKTEDEYGEHETNWHSDILFDFCPDCRIRSDVQTVIDEEVDSVLMEIF